MTLATQLCLDDARHSWEVLAAQLEALLRAWDTAAEPPDLAEFLPPGPASIRRLVLIELVKVDLEYRWTRGLDPLPVEKYAERFPELAADGGVPGDLLFEEFHIRRRAGESIEAAAFCRRYPHRKDELARLLGLSAATQSTAMFRGVALTTVEAGQSLDDFNLLTLLGEGAFAKVFLAHQRSMGRRVALKVSADHGEESRTLAQLDHAHIVRVFDQRIIADRRIRLLYMHYVAGGTLHSVLDHARTIAADRRSGKTVIEAVDAVLSQRGEEAPADSNLRRKFARMNWPEAVCWMGARLAEALDYAHKAGVMHRDVKPANVLLTAEGSPRLADFNVGASQNGAGPAAFFGGSLGYMAPEHLEAFNPIHPRQPSDLDGRADQYSLGVTLWELLTGSRPFADERLEGDWFGTLEALAARRRAGVSAEARALVPKDCPPGLVEVLLTCLAPDPQHRFPDAGTLARELELCLHPDARDLLRPAPGGWRAIARHSPILTAVPIGLIPNVIASIINILYNQREIIDPLSLTHGDAAQEAFDRFIMVINPVFFSLGIMVFLSAFWLVSTALRRREAGERLLPAEAARARRRTLRLGLWTSGVCAGCWLTAGLIWPLSMESALGPLEGWVYDKFFASLAVCGLMAAAYPFLVVTFLSVRVFYPALVQPEDPVDPAEMAQLARLEGQLWPFVALAVAVPLLSVVLLAVVNTSKEYIALDASILSLTGLAGLSLSYVLWSILRRDLRALRYAAPTGD